MPGLSGLSNQSCERRFLPRGASVFGFLVMTILGRFGIRRGGCAERRGGRKEVQKKLKSRRNAEFAWPGFRHGFVIEIFCGPRCYIIRATRVYALRFALQ